MDSCCHRSVASFVLFLAGSFISCCAAVPVFYPFGPASGDQSLQGHRDESSSPALQITTPFPFFGTLHDTIHVNINGLLSFGSAVPDYASDPFPILGYVVIAPFWADVDIQGIGEVYYRETNDAGLLQNVSAEIQKGFKDVNLTSLFIATWDSVGYYDNNTELTNTFQCILATDGVTSFVAFLYADIEWTTADVRTTMNGNGSMSAANVSLEGTPAQIGFNAGDGERFLSLPDSRTEAVLDISSSSNVGEPGLWIFQVDGDNITSGISHTTSSGSLIVSATPTPLPAGESPCTTAGFTTCCNEGGDTCAVQNTNGETCYCDFVCHLNRDCCDNIELTCPEQPDDPSPASTIPPQHPLTSITTVVSSSGLNHSLLLPSTLLVTSMKTTTKVFSPSASVTSMQSISLLPTIATTGVSSMPAVPSGTQNDVFSIDTTVVIGGIVAGIVILVLVVVGSCTTLFLICHKRKKKVANPVLENLALRQAGGLSHDFINGRESPDPYTKLHRQRTLSVDSAVLRDLPTELTIPSCCLRLLNTIGQGEFGIVYKAHMIASRKTLMSSLSSSLGASPTMPEIVAVKTLRGFFDHNQVADMLKECVKMKDFDHPNVLSLIGVCVDGGPTPYMVMPYMALGSLLLFMKKRRGEFVLDEDAEKSMIMDCCKRLMDMCAQVAKGMQYLASRKFVHRDLAARNCMIDNYFVIKIADFGLSESIYSKNYFRQGKSGSVKLPVKWMAPECLSDCVFSEKTDVWSFGITCWEVFSGGKIPYPGVDSFTLIEKLESGYRLWQPKNAACSDEMYSIMMSCWEEDPEKRPSFADLVKTISRHLQSMSDYLDVVSGSFSHKKSNPFNLVPTKEEFDAANPLQPQESLHLQTRVTDDPLVSDTLVLENQSTA